MENKQTKHPLLGLLIAQFIAAFSDNAWKLIIFTLATRSLLNGDPETLASASQMKATLSLVIFLLPMLLFSFPAGALADRMSKRTLIFNTRIVEFLLMVAATLSLYLTPTHLLIPYILLALMGAQSALLSPAKYGILPELLPKERLSVGNGLLEMWTMIAIIVGTGLGPVLLFADKGGTIPALTWTAPLWLMFMAGVGLLASYKVPKVPVARTQYCSMIGCLREAKQSIVSDRVLLLAIMGCMCYWFILSLLGQNVLVYAKALVHDLQKGELLQGIPPASFGVGIAVGALLGGKLSGGRIETGLIPLGAMVFAAMALLLGLLEPGMVGAVLILVLMGIGSGLLIVPLNSLIQWRAPSESRGAVIALGNILNIFGMIAGSLGAVGMALAGLNLGKILVVSALFVIAATCWAIWLLPEALVRLGFIILTRTFYRIQIIGSQHIPKSGSALLACNHLSFVDTFFILAAVDRPIRFIIREDYYQKWWIKPFAKLLKAIPISNNDEAPATLRALRGAGKYLDRGDLVCIFPEGEMSHTGMLQPFHRGLELILKGHKAPLIPVYLDGVLGSIFSYHGGQRFHKFPRKIPYPLTVSFGEPLAPETPVSILHQAVQSLGYEAWIARKEKQMPIHRYFVRNVRRAPLKTALADSSQDRITRYHLLTSAITLARALRKKISQQPNLGILLPSGASTVIANVAASLSGRCAINLNYSSGLKTIVSEIQVAELKSLVTSRKFLDEANCALPSHLQLFFIEDLLSESRFLNRLIAGSLALFSPCSWLEKACGSDHKQDVDDLLTIIFTSGSTGDPKGVMLSHFNLNSNVESIGQVIPTISNQDKLLGILPLYHGFGYMLMWLGLNNGIGLVMHSNPLDAQAVGKLIQKHKVTFLFATPTLLRIYLHKLKPQQLATVKCVLAGAEKLSSQLADEFEHHFGIRPIEGYGTTECAPVIATSTLDVRVHGIYQPGSAKGAVGHPLPGVAIKVVDAETFEPLPPDHSGLLLVKGPNVMRGYWKQEELTKKYMHQGWYITGDIGEINADGFLRITDRLARFSKIGGEMVSHSYVEEVLHKAAAKDSPIFAVTAVPDSHKGEALVVLHTIEQAEIHTLLQKLPEQGIPNLFIPKPDSFIKVEALPTLPSGKLDLRAAKAIAAKARQPANGQ